jgi:hypothetical protein
MNRRDGMVAGNGILKIVWLEGNAPHCVFGELVSEDDHFMIFKQRDGALIKLGKGFIIKTEEVSR